jgi:hypothetical protein
VPAPATVKLRLGAASAATADIARMTATESTRRVVEVRQVVDLPMEVSM